MSQFFKIHPRNPQLRLLARAAEIISAGGLVCYPTDSCYALGCKIGDAKALKALCAIRNLPENHAFTLVCRDLSNIAEYAVVDNRQYRLLKACVPGPYTFILQATKKTPRHLFNPKRRAIGIRVPSHPVTAGLLGQLDEPLVSTSLILPGDELPLTDPEEIEERLGSQVALVIDSGICANGLTTVIDLSSDSPVLVRTGLGDPSFLTQERL